MGNSGRNGNGVGGGLKTGTRKGGGRPIITGTRGGTWHSLQEDSIRGGGCPSFCSFTASPSPSAGPRRDTVCLAGAGIGPRRLSCASASEFHLSRRDTPASHCLACIRNEPAPRWFWVVCKILLLLLAPGPEEPHERSREHQHEHEVVFPSRYPSIHPPPRPHSPQAVGYGERVRSTGFFFFLARTINFPKRDWGSRPCVRLR